MTRLNVLTTRLFPKFQGADRYELSGIAKRCDWVVSTDRSEPCFHVFKQSAGQPTTIFLSLRCHEVALRHFCNVVLKELTEPFVLISGSEDVTLPHQQDVRWKPLDAELQACVRKIHDHPGLVRWFVENLDDATFRKMTPFPLGLVLTDAPKIRERIDVPEVSRLQDRPLKALCGHRVREGGQWDLRKHVSDLAQSSWSGFVNILADEVAEADFLSLVREHAFVICAEGGGHDPSPKAWQTILNGAIPIIRRTALAPAYEHLPVLFVDEWEPSSLSPEILLQARDSLAPFFDDADQRAEVLQRLGLDYWWSQITAAIPAEDRVATPVA